MHLENVIIRDQNGEDKPSSVLFTPDGYIATHVTRWIRYLTLDTTLAYGSIKRYVEGIISLYKYLICEGPKQNIYGDPNEILLDINRYVVDGWLSYEREVRCLSSSTLRLREEGVKKFYLWTQTTGSGLKSRCKNHPYSCEEKSTTRSSRYRRQANSFNEETLLTLLLSFHNECERTFWQFAYDSGLRISELMSLTKGAIDIAKEVYRVSLENSIYDPLQRKNIRYIPIMVPTLKKRESRDGFGKEEPVFISVPTLERVFEYHQTPSYEFSKDWHPCDPYKPAFLTPTGLKWKYSNAAKQLKKALNRSSLNYINIHPHMFRHSSVVSILTSSDHGKTHLDRFFSASVNLRHASFTTTETYAHLPWDSLYKLSIDDSVYNRALRLKEKTHLSIYNHKKNRGHR